MTTVEENAKKTSKKSRLSSAYKSEISKKSLNHKQKIVNAIKRSTLKPYHQPKPRKSTKSRNSISTTDKKKKITPYQIQSQRTRTNKTVSSMSRTVPVKYSKQKMLQFPFQAIKFKHKETEPHQNQNKTHDGFYIRYDEPQMAQMDMSVLQNSKKIIGPHNQRIGRYSQLKGKVNRVEIVSGVKNAEFRQCVLKLFMLLDPHYTHVISHAQIDHRKVPQAVLYFLGGLFQRIREKNLYLSQKEFSQECDQIYLRSSDQDSKWFIQEVKQMALIAQERPRQVNQSKLKIKNTQTQATHKDLTQQSRVEQKIEPVKTKSPQQTNPHQYYNFKNLPLEQKQSSEISFRRQHKDSQALEQYQSKTSHPSERQSQQSAQFGYQAAQKFSFNANERPSFASFGSDQQKVKSNIDFIIQPFKAEERKILTEMQKDSRNGQVRSGGIKKNIVDKAEDMKEQIYARLDRMKISQQTKDTNLIRENFKIQLEKGNISNLSSARNLPQQNTLPIMSTTQKNYRYLESFPTVTQNKQSKTSWKYGEEPSRLNQKSPLQEKKQTNVLKEQKANICGKSEKIDKNEKVQWKQSKDSEWVIKNKNCESAFGELQRLRDQFKKHKNTVELKQVERQNYFKDQSYKKNLPPQQQVDFVLEQQTRILKLSSKKPIYQQKINDKQNSVGYQKNIDRLVNLSNLRELNTLSINSNETLSNSCRKSVQIYLPLKCEVGKSISLSDKKPITSSKIDKIDLLSDKLEQYLMKNAQKIEYSKNFTQNTGQNYKFNRFLAF